MNVDNPLDWLDGRPQPTLEEDAAEQQRQLEAMNQAQYELSKLYADVFTQGRGPELLAHLRNCTIETPLIRLTQDFGGNDFPLSPSDWAYLRTGQNSVVHEIERRLALALAPPPAPKPATQPEGEPS